MSRARMKRRMLKKCFEKISKNLNSLMTPPPRNFFVISEAQAELLHNLSFDHFIVAQKPMTATEVRLREEDHKKLFKKMSGELRTHWIEKFCKPTLEDMKKKMKEYGLL